ncbi:MAG TPA: hypothetical protein VGM23_14680, partial [Armatimonadota bacterium]
MSSPAGRGSEPSSTANGTDGAEVGGRTRKRRCTPPGRLTLTGSTPTPAEAAGHLLNLPVEEVRRRFAATYGRTPSPPPAPPAANAPAPHTMDWWGQRLQSGEPLFSYEEGL